MLKACFTIKTIHNYTGLIIIFYLSFSSCRDEIRTQFIAVQTVQHTGLQDPVETGKYTQVKVQVAGLRWENPSAAKMGTQPPEGLSPGLLLLAAFGMFSFHTYFESLKW